MILVLAGTKDGRELAVRLAQNGWPVVVSVVSEYGRSLTETPGITVIAGQLTLADMAEIITSRAISALVDASHPYAVNVSVNAMTACRTAGVKYIRYERSEVEVPVYDKLYRTVDATAAAKLAAGLGEIIFLTTGSRTLNVFKTEPLLTECRLIVRVLPQPEIVAECLKLGFSPEDIVAIKGPFSHELNLALFKEYGAQVIVTKNSGTVGGTDTKISAAVELGLPLIVIDRPVISYQNLCRTEAAVLAQVGSRTKDKKEIASLCSQ